MVFQINGGTGITTAASDSGDDGKVVINADTADFLQHSGVAKFNSGNFAVDAGDVTIKGGGVDTAQLAASAVETAKIDRQLLTLKLTTQVSAAQVKSLFWLFGSTILVLTLRTRQICTLPTGSS